MEREADGPPVLAARHELAQDFDVVVLGVEEAFVEWLLERHHHRSGRARKPSSHARLQHWSSMSGRLCLIGPKEALDATDGGLAQDDLENDAGARTARLEAQGFD